MERSGMWGLRNDTADRVLKNDRILYIVFYIILSELYWYLF
ncbi:hypothetical protein Barb7_02887 [Bacteroidales bacterium Barb7]|nr:hypothetical protein Barb7_02887 [Bacteroidales bacterium Barb7]